MAENTSVEKFEDEGSRHRQERRELQAAIQQLKKSVNKNDKARKKKLDSEIKALEEEFEKKWHHFNENSTPATVPDIPIVPDTATTQSDVNLPETQDKQHVSRKARRQANKAKREAEIHANEEVIDYDNHPDAIRCRNESSTINEQLLERGLKLHSIASDGNCMYASITHQEPDFTVRKLREAVANYLRQHRNEYEPFIESDFDVYCDKLAKENVWGGQVELQVCAKLVQRSIEIIQGNNNESIKIDIPTSSKPPIVITYHRYLYSNGEHYNSTVNISEDDDD